MCKYVAMPIVMVVKVSVGVSGGGFVPFSSVELWNLTFYIYRLHVLHLHFYIFTFYICSKYLTTILPSHLKGLQVARLRNS